MLAPSGARFLIIMAAAYLRYWGAKTHNDGVLFFATPTRAKKSR
jgi:hypothetical protein